MTNEGPPRTLRLTIAYDGTGLVGWQRQADGVSVQGLLEEALARLEGRPVTIIGAGRTDAGVHATGQVASVVVSAAHDVATVRRALNAMVPPAVRVLVVEDVRPSFHARFDARAKEYHYRIFEGPICPPFAARYVWHVARPLDDLAMHAAARTLEGTHDFAAFQSTGSAIEDTTRRLLRSSVEVGWPSQGPAVAPLVPETPVEGRSLVYVARGSGFLRHMVRAIVGTLVEIGTARATPDLMTRLLERPSRAAAGPTAPAHGLCLAAVDYDAATDGELRPGDKTL